MDSPMRLRIRDIQARALVGPLATPVRTASGSVTQDGTRPLSADTSWPDPGRTRPATSATLRRS